MKVKIDNEYKLTINALIRKMKKYTFLFELESVLQFDFQLEDEYIRISAQTEYDTKTVRYLYKELHRCEVRSNGYILTFKDKRFIFLPVTNNEDSNIELLEIGEDFSMRYNGFRFVDSERLCFFIEDEEGGKKKTVKIGFSIASFPVVIFVVAVLAAIMATFFIMNSWNIVEVKEECSSYTGIFENYKQDSNGHIDIYFKNGDFISIHQSCVSDEVTQKLESLDTGETLNLLVDSDWYAFEIRTDNYEILNFDVSQMKMRRETLGLMGVGIFIYADAGFLFVYGVVVLIKENKKKKP